MWIPKGAALTRVDTVTINFVLNTLRKRKFLNISDILAKTYHVKKTIFR